MSISLIDNVRVSTLAELKSLTSRPPRVITGGYLSDGDGGGGPDWLWVPGSSATADDFLVVNPTSGPSGRYIRNLKEGQAVSPKWAGCGISGLNDDSVQFQKVINSGRPVDCSGATYYLMNIAVGVNASQRIFADGTGIIIQAATSTSSSNIFLLSRDNITFDGLRFNLAAELSNYLVAARPPINAAIANPSSTSVNNITIKNCRHTGGTTFVSLIAGTFNDISIIDNYIEDAWGNAINIDSGTRNHIERNTILRGGVSNSLSSGAISVGNLSTTVPYQLTRIADNIISQFSIVSGSTSRASIYCAVPGASDIEITGNICSQNGSGIEFTTNSTVSSPDAFQKIKVSNNLIRLTSKGATQIRCLRLATSSTGISAAKLGYIMITDNFMIGDSAISSDAIDGIDLDGYSNVLIANNYIYGVARGISPSNSLNLIENSSSNLMIENNVIDVLERGIFISGNTDFVWNNTKIRNNHIRSGNVAIQYGGSVSKNTFVHSGTTITGNYLRSSTSYGIDMRLATDVQISRNSIVSDTSNAFALLNTCFGVIVDDNDLISMGTNACSVSSTTPASTNIIISRNRVTVNNNSRTVSGAGAFTAFDNYRNPALTVSIVTNAATSAGSNVLTFASIPSTISSGWQVFGINIPSGTTISAVNSPSAGNITLSGNVTGTGVASGATIWVQNTQASITDPTSSYGGSVGDRIINQNIAANTPVEWYCIVAGSLGSATWKAIYKDDNLTVATLASLKALTYRPNRVKTQGYTSAGDGGGGPEWQWVAGSSTTADDFMVVQPTSGPSGRYIRKFSETSVLNPRWAGCVMDGTTDDTANFQKVLNLGGTIQIDADMVVSAVTCSVAKTHLRGSNGAKIISKAGSTTTTLQITADYIRVENLRFEALNSPGLQRHLWINGNYYHITGCRFVGTTSSMLTSSVIPAPYYGIHITGPSQQSGLPMFEEGHISNCRVFGGNNGFSLSGQRRFQMSDCSATNCHGFGCVIGSGLSVQGCQITNFFALSCGLYGFTNSGLSYYASVDPVPMSGWQLTNLHSENCGWRTYFTGADGALGSTKYGFDLTDNGINGLQVKASARNCANGGLEDKGSAFPDYNTSLTTSSSTASGSTLPFSSVPSTVIVGQTVTGTNIASDTYVASLTSTSVTLTRAITGTVSSGATISFSANIQPSGHRNTTIDFQYVSHLDWAAEGIGLYMSDTGSPSAFTQNHHIRLHSVLEQAPSWRSLLHRRPFDIAADGLLSWMCLGDSTGKAGTTGMNFPSSVLGSNYLKLTTNNTTSSGSAVLNFADTTGVVDGMNVFGLNVQPNAYVVSHTSTTVTISSNVINSGVANPAPIAFAAAGHRVMVTSSSTASGAVLNFSSTNNVQVGQTVWGINIHDGTTVSSKTSTTVTLSANVSGTVASGATIIFATVITDGSLNWVCMGYDSSGASIQHVGFRTYGGKNISLDLESIGNYYGLYLTTNSGTDNIYANLKCRARIRDATIGLSIAGTGTLSNATFMDCDVEATAYCIYNQQTSGTVTFDVIGGRYKANAGSYCLRSNGGTTTMRIDGGAYLMNTTGRAVWIQGSGTHTILCGAATFEGGYSNTPVVELSNGSGSWDWGQAVIYQGYTGAPGYKISGGTMTSRGQVLRQDITTAPSSSKQASPGEYMRLASPTTTEYGYLCQASDFVTPTFTWKKLALT